MKNRIELTKPVVETGGTVAAIEVKRVVFINGRVIIAYKKVDDGNTIIGQGRKLLTDPAEITALATSFTTGDSAIEKAAEKLGTEPVFAGEIKEPDAQMKPPIK